MKAYAKYKDSGYNVSPKRRKTKAVKKSVRQQTKKEIRVNIVSIDVTS
jgi:hypothetical protein